MAKKTNPFSLLFGKAPSQYISRISQAEIILNAFTGETPVTQVYMITGVRGSGKTVMMTSIANQLVKDNSWIVINLNPTRDMLYSLASKLYNQPVFKPLLTEMKIDLSILGIGVSISKSDKISDIESAIEAILKVSKKLQKRILITIDEVTNDNYVKEFISAFQIFIREDYPLFLLMTGLYENIQQLKDNKALTFLYRAPKLELAPLNISAVKNAYMNTLKCSDSTAGWLATQTMGYSYAFQVLGYLCWEYDGDDYATVIPEYVQYLEEYSYEKIWSELTAVEKEIITIISQTDLYQIKDIREQIGFDSNKFTVYRSRLIHKGILTSPSYGEIRLALPYFKDFVMSRSYYN